MDETPDRQKLFSQRIVVGVCVAGERSVANLIPVFFLFFSLFFAAQPYPGNTSCLVAGGEVERRQR